MGTPVGDDEISGIVAPPAQAPGSIGVRLTMISGTVVGLDAAAHGIDVVHPSVGGIYTVEVTNPSRAAMLCPLKVGDTITAVIRQALAFSIDRRRGASSEVRLTAVGRCRNCIAQAGGIHNLQDLANPWPRQHRLWRKE